MTVNISRKDMLLYAVTDRSWLGANSLCDQVKECLEGGATCIQLREKNLNRDKLILEARQIQRLCKEYQVPFILNDDVELAIAIDADGVHVGQSDTSAQVCRERMGADKIIGVSAHSVQEAVLAEKMGADYLGVGSVFQTGTKKDAHPISRQTLQAICQTVKIPVVAIGGIQEANADQLAGTGIAGIAVVSAVFAQRDIFRATKRLKEKVSRIVQQEIKDQN